MKDSQNVFSADIDSLGHDGKLRVSWPMSRRARAMLQILLRSRRQLTIKEMFETYRKLENSRVDDKKLMKEFKEMYFYAKMTGQILLKKKSVQDFPKMKTLTLFKFSAS